MSTSLLELVELPNGDIALKKADSDEQLVNIHFSEESEIALSQMKMLVARAMIEAGIDAFTEINNTKLQELEESGTVH